MRAPEGEARAKARRKLRFAARRPFLKNKRIFGAQDIADAFNTPDDPWDTRKAKRWLRATRLGMKLGGRWVTTRSRLQRLEPDMLGEILARLDHGDDDI